MGLRTIAEYVSSEQILEQVRLIGVDYAQGFAIARPHPLDEGVTAAPRMEDGAS